MEAHARTRLTAFAVGLLLAHCASTGLPDAIDEEYHNLATHAAGIEQRAIRLHQANTQGRLLPEHFATARQLYRDAQAALDHAVTRLERAAASGRPPEASGMYLDAVRAAVTALGKFRDWSDGVVEPPNGRGFSQNSNSGETAAVDPQTEPAPETRDKALASEIGRHRASEQQRKAWMVAVLDSLRLRRFESLGPPPPPGP